MDILFSQVNGGVMTTTTGLNPCCNGYSIQPIVIEDNKIILNQS